MLPSLVSKRRLHHISKLCTKISRGIGVIRRLKTLVPNDVLKQLYYSFIHSHYTYAITSYQSAYLNQTQKLKNLINKALKIVLNLDSLNEDNLKSKSMMNYEMCVEYFCCIYMYRILKTDSHQFFKNKISSFQIEHEHETRASNLGLFNLPFYRLSKCKRSFLYMGLSFWNKLPLDMRNITNNVKCFKTMMRNLLFK